MKKTLFYLPILLLSIASIKAMKHPQETIKPDYFFTLEFSNNEQAKFALDVLRTSKTFETYYQEALKQGETSIPFREIKKKDFMGFIFPIMAAHYSDSEIKLNRKILNVQKIRLIDRKRFKCIKHAIRFLDFGVTIAIPKQAPQPIAPVQRPQENKIKRVYDALPIRKVKTLINLAAKVAFSHWLKTDHPKKQLSILPRELIAKYIDRPLDPTKRTPIYYAKDIEKLDQLIQLGADYRTVHDIIDHDTPTNFAVKFIQSIAPTLINKLKEPLPSGQPAPIDQPDLAGNNYIDNIRLLSNSSVHTSAQRNVDGRNKFFLNFENQDLKTIIAQYKKEGLNINQQDIWGNTPLIFALKCLRPTAAQELICAGAQVDAIDKNQRTALMYAIMLRYNSLMPLLMPSKLSKRESYLLLVKRDNTNKNILDLALEYNIDALAYLFTHYNFPPEFLNIIFRKAIKYNQKAVNFLIESGADINTKTCYRKTSRTYANNGKTPLIIAASSGNADPELIKKLLNEGANPNIVYENARKQHTALSFAITAENNHIIPTLIEGGANINQRLPNGDYIIHFAACFNPSALEHLLNSQNQSLNINVQSPTGFTALMFLIDFHTGDIEILKQLLKAGPNLELKNSSGETALNMAASRYITSTNKSHANSSYLTFLLKAGAECNTQDNSGNTPLMNLCTIFSTNPNIHPAYQYDSESTIDAMKLLIQAEAAINTLNNKQETVLHLALAFAQPRIIEFLLSNKIDCNRQNDDGNTALMRALQKYINPLPEHLKHLSHIHEKPVDQVVQDLQQQYKEIVKLLWHQTDRSLINNDNETAEDLARRAQLNPADF